MADKTTKSWKPLAGVYKAFFNVPSHKLVEEWYNRVAKLQDRHALKGLVKDILAFDMAHAIQASGKATYDPDIPLANAIVAQHGGEHLTDASRKLAVEYLSMCHPSKREQYRRTFGLITRPSNLCTLRHRDEMNPERTYVEVETSLLPKKKLIAGEHIHQKSNMRTLPMNAQTGNKTHYQQHFVWKYGSVPLAYSQRAVDRRDAQLARQSEDMELLEAVQTHIHSGVTTPFVAPAKKRNNSHPQILETTVASGATGHGSAPPDLMPTPWGVLNTGNVDGTQWESVTHDTFKSTYYLQPKDQRLFQNLNDNYSRMVYLTRRKLKKDRKLAEQQQQRDLSEPSAALVNFTGVHSCSGNAFELSGSQSQKARSSAPPTVYGELRSASTTLPLPSGGSKSSLQAWLAEKGRRPVSVVFPSI